MQSYALNLHLNLPLPFAFALVVAVTVNHENLVGVEISDQCRSITRDTGIPAFDVLRDGADGLVEILRWQMRRMEIAAG